MLAFIFISFGDAKIAKLSDSVPDPVKIIPFELTFKILAITVQRFSIAVFACLPRRCIDDGLPKYLPLDKAPSF